MIIHSEEARKYTTDILVTDPDAELRDYVSKQPNGEYACIICRSCEEFFTTPYKDIIINSELCTATNPYGNVALATVVDNCPKCISKKQVVDIEVNAPALIVNNLENVIETLQATRSGLEKNMLVEEALSILYETSEMANRLVEYNRLLQKNGDRVSIGWTEFLDQLKEEELKEGMMNW